MFKARSPSSASKQRIPSRVEVLTNAVRMRHTRLSSETGNRKHEQGTYVAFPVQHPRFTCVTDVHQPNDLCPPRAGRSGEESRDEDENALMTCLALCGGSKASTNAVAVDSRDMTPLSIKTRIST